MLQGLECSFGKRLEHGTYAIRKIEKEHDRQRELVLAEGRDLLRDAVFVELKVVCGEARDRASSLLVDYDGIDDGEVYIDFDHVARVLRLSVGRSILCLKTRNAESREQQERKSYPLRECLALNEILIDPRSKAKAAES